MPVLPAPSPALFSCSSTSPALITGYSAPFVRLFNCPLPPTSRPSGPIWSPVAQPYVGSPPTFGSAFTTRTAPISWRASSSASPWPTAFSTGAAASFAAFSLTADSWPPGA